MLKPNEEFTPSQLSDVELTEQYRLNQEVNVGNLVMKVVGKVAKGYSSEGVPTLYARVRYFDPESNRIRVGYATEVLG